MPDPESKAALGMIERQHVNLHAGNVEGPFGKFDVIPRARQIRNIHREVGIRHHCGEGVTAKLSVVPFCEVKGEMVARIVQRPKKRNPLDVVQMKMAEEDMTLDGIAVELVLQLLSQEANAGSAIKNENLVVVRSDFDARRIAAESHVL